MLGVSKRIAGEITNNHSDDDGDNEDKGANRGLGSQHYAAPRRNNKEQVAQYVRGLLVGSPN